MLELTKLQVHLRDPKKDFKSFLEESFNTKYGGKINKLPKFFRENTLVK